MPGFGRAAGSEGGRQRLTLPALGGGGGLVIVPLLVLTLAQTQHIAQGVFPAVIVPTAIAGAITYYRKGNVDVPLARVTACGVVIGSLIGSTVAAVLADGTLRKVFAVALILLAYRALPPTLWQDVRNRVRGLGGTQADAAP